MQSRQIKVILQTPHYISDLKARILEALAYALTNEAISKNLDISIKTVESNITSLSKRWLKKQDSTDLKATYNLRQRLLLTALVQNHISYNFDAYSDPVNLDEELYLLLLLVMAGLSNNYLASLFALSTKAIEARLSQLYDYFNVDTKVYNPRVALFLIALSRNNVSITVLEKIYKETTLESLDIYKNDLALLQSNLQSQYKFIG